MAFVLDCSVTMAWIFPDEATEATHRLRDSLVEGRAFVPSLWPVEVGNAVAVATREPVSRAARRRADRGRGDARIQVGMEVPE